MNDYPTPRQIVLAWLDAFNKADIASLVALYANDAVNHQVAESPVHGKDAILARFQQAFASATMVCIMENLFEDGQWAILE